MYTVALTGGIGSGKSTVSAIFAQLGAAVVDADVVSRELMRPGQPALHQVAQRFGKDLLDEQGVLNRALLRQRVFADTAQRRHLEAIMHPLIRDAMWRQVKQADAPYVVLVVPLLYEHQADYPTHRVLLVDVPEAIQRSRVKRRDQLDDVGVDRILASQSQRDQRLQIADDVIHNTTTLAGLQVEVARLHQCYLRLADVALIERETQG